MNNTSAQIRASLSHPLIDGDSHIIEYLPVLMDYIKEAGGEDAVTDFRTNMRGGRQGPGWYQMDWDERRDTRSVRAPWWALPTKNTFDRCTAMLPKLYHSRMDDFGLDFVVLYPTTGLGFHSIPNQEYRQLACHAYNEYAAAAYAEYQDRMTVAAVIPLHTPEEGIRELEHAHALGMKVAMIPSFVRRPVPSAARDYPELENQLFWLDNLSIDSEHDYDPFWARCIELGFPVAAHSGGMGFHERSSISNYMHNHMGHFAAAGEVLAKGLLMGGVTCRYPDLRVALLEGGVINGARLYTDIVGRWKKRNAAGLENLNPANIDLTRAQDLFQQYGDAATLAKLEQLPRSLGVGGHDIPPEVRDDFAAMGISRAEDIRDRFIPNFYFGCESDDSLAFTAFNRKANPFGEQVRAVMSFDLGHWDVLDMGHAAAEAYEQLEHELISEEDFRNFAFSFSVQLYAGNNPGFFDGTRIEDAVKAELHSAA
ncbi:MAG: amidohydrolase family protein [Gammaproteobacteria bacterium]|nr:amidohydrolase family protein [Gammaproteobacteria bacterium]